MFLEMGLSIFVFNDEFVCFFNIFSSTHPA